MNSSSEQLEREAEASRESIADNLEELRNRMTAGNVVDELMEYAQSGTAGQFTGNLRAQVVANPLPVALIGAGLGRLLMVGRSKTPIRSPSLQPSAVADRFGAAMEGAREAATDLGSSVQEKTSQAAEGISESARNAAGNLAGRARSSASGIADTADKSTSRMSEGARSATSSVAHALSEASRGAADRLQQGAEAARTTTARWREQAGETNRSAIAFVREQPLVMVGLGVAIGSMLGALLPGTETEDHVMGQASDQLKNAGTDFARAQVDHAGEDFASTMQQSSEPGQDNFSTPKKSDEPARVESPATIPHHETETAESSARSREMTDASSGHP
jgi:ElaB/YqjD/DUF883 family membrane-anchored ribosome-binding protein